MKLISFLDYAHNRRLTGFHVGDAASTLAVDKRTVYRWMDRSAANGFSVRFSQHPDPQDKRRTLFYLVGRPDFFGDRDKLRGRIAQLEADNTALSGRLNAIMELSSG